MEIVLEWPQIAYLILIILGFVGVATNAKDNAQQGSAIIVYTIGLVLVNTLLYFGGFWTNTGECL